MTRQQWFGVLRTIISLAMASWAINWVLSQAGGNLRYEFLHCNYAYIVLAVICFAMGTVLSSYRWWSLLRLQQVMLGQWDTFRLTMIGVFFNLVGLGGVGGDVLKMVYVRRHAGERTPEAVLSILVDRILGLLGLFILALITLPFVWGELSRSTNLIRSLVGFVVVVAVIGGGAVTLVLARDWWLPASAKESLKNVSRRFPVRLVTLIARVVRSLDLYRDQLPQLFKALMVSALVHTCATLAVICVGLSFSIEGLALRHYFLAVQVANTISAVPITPGGLGSRDLILLEFFKALGGDPRAALVPPVMSCILVLWSLVGGLFFLTEKQSAPVQEENHDEVPA